MQYNILFSLVGSSIRLWGDLSSRKNLLFSLPTDFNKNFEFLCVISLLSWSRCNIILICVHLASRCNCLNLCHEISIFFSQRSRIGRIGLSPIKNNKDLTFYLKLIYFKNQNLFRIFEFMQYVYCTPAAVRAKFNKIKTINVWYNNHKLKFKFCASCAARSAICNNK